MIGKALLSQDNLENILMTMTESEEHFMSVFRIVGQFSMTSHGVFLTEPFSWTFMQTLEG